MTQEDKSARMSSIGTPKITLDKFTAKEREVEFNIDYIAQLRRDWTTGEIGGGYRKIDDAEFETLCNLAIAALSARSAIKSPDRWFLETFLKAIDWHGGHGTPSLERASAMVLEAEAKKMLAIVPETKMP